MRFPICLLFLTAATLQAQPQQIVVAPIPTWVKPVEFNKKATSTDSVSTSGGYYDLLFDDQYNLATKHNYFHYAQLIISEKGLENISTLAQNYDPAYQQLIFHLIRVIRNGEVTDQLSKERIELIRREENMERAVYDGSLTAVFHFENLRVGDIVEYAFSYKGYNPILSHYSHSFYFNYNSPVAKIYTRVVAEKNRNFNVKHFNQPPNEKILIQGSQKEYIWETSNIKALLYDEGTPGWYEGYNRVDFSEYNSWADVAKWGSNLYEQAFMSTPIIQQQIANFKKEKNKEEAVNKCIRFVQDEVRYLSFSDGINGYKPHAASQILSQRYGDCKDKSVLLSLMLKGMGLKSSPVLVHTSTGKFLSEALPSQRNFNHCIVQFTLNDSVYWIDPTMNLQRGKLNERFTPNYTYGLILSPETKSLSAIPYESRNSSISIKENFKVAAVGTTAILDVSIQYGGDEANSTREYFLSNSLDEITKGYLNFYANDYRQIQSEQNVSFKDDEIANIFITKEKYFISNFWTYDSAKSKYSSTIYPRTLAGYLSKPSTKIRTMPYGLTYPRNVDYEISVMMPEQWSAEKVEKKIETGAFSYSSSTSYKDSVITSFYKLKIKKAFIDASETNEYLQKVDAVVDDLSLVLTYTTPATTDSSKLNYPFAIILLVVSGLLFFGLREVLEFDPEPLPSPEHHYSIGGWLILPAIGLCLMPIRIIYDLIQTDYFRYSNWQLIADPNYSSFNPILGSIIIGELVVNFCMLAYVVLVAILFFKRRSNVPRLASILYAGNFVIVFGDALIIEAVNLDGFNSETSKEIFQSIIAASIWIPYFLTSNRSKGTFVVRYSSDSN